MVVDYLSRGLVALTYMGKSPCRLCGARAGSLEVTDSTYLWPDGLAHYVEVHHVRLPPPFVDHIVRTTEDFESAEIDDDWWPQVMA